MRFRTRLHSLFTGKRGADVNNTIFFNQYKSEKAIGYAELSIFAFGKYTGSRLMRWVMSKGWVDEGRDMPGCSI